jgi:hypothetical protein
MLVVMENYLPYRIYRRATTPAQRIFWAAVERDRSDPMHVPPAEVLELLDAGTGGVPANPDRYAEICAWATTIEGWRFAPRPMYARGTSVSGPGPEIDMGS